VDKRRGVVVSVVSDENFGFIADDDKPGHNQVHFVLSDVNLGGTAQVEEGCEVEYELMTGREHMRSTGPAGPCAKNVKLLAKQPTSDPE